MCLSLYVPALHFFVIQCMRYVWPYSPIQECRIFTCYLVRDLVSTISSYSFLQIDQHMTVIGVQSMKTLFERNIVVCKSSNVVSSCVDDDITIWCIMRHTYDHIYYMGCKNWKNFSQEGACKFDIVCCHQERQWP